MCQALLPSSCVSLDAILLLWGPLSELSLSPHLLPLSVWVSQVLCILVCVSLCPCLCRALSLSPPWCLTAVLPWSLWVSEGTWATLASPPTFRPLPSCWWVPTAIVSSQQQGNVLRLQGALSWWPGHWPHPSAKSGSRRMGDATFLSVTEGLESQTPLALVSIPPRAQGLAGLSALPHSSACTLPDPHSTLGTCLLFPEDSLA